MQRGYHRQGTGYIKFVLGRLLLVCGLFTLVGCSTHTAHVALNQSDQKTLKVIGIPHFKTQNRIDIRQENPVYAIIGMSAKAVQLIAREAKRIQYEDENPRLMKQSIMQMRTVMKKRLRKLGYRVKYLNMSYWQAQSGYRQGDPRLKDVDALLNVELKQYGYFSASPFKPYRPGIVLVADLITTSDRKRISSNVYNVGFDKEDISLLSFRVSYSTNVYVADQKYFYKNFRTLMSDAKSSSKGLKFVSRVAAESVAGDLKKRVANPYLVVKK